VLANNTAQKHFDYAGYCVENIEKEDKAIEGVIETKKST